jgi:hypothetical protein
MFLARDLIAADYYNWGRFQKPLEGEGGVRWVGGVEGSDLGREAGPRPEGTTEMSLGAEAAAAGAEVGMTDSRITRVNTGWREGTGGRRELGERHTGCPVLVTRADRLLIRTDST